MAKCWFCKTKKGERYCAPIDNVLCPICCGENRLKRVDCIEECRYLEGLAYQKNRTEEKEFPELSMEQLTITYAAHPKYIDSIMLHPIED